MRTLTDGVSERQARWTVASRGLFLLLILALLAAACGTDGDAGDVSQGESPVSGETAEDEGQVQGDARGGDIRVGVGSMTPLDAFAATSPPRSYMTYPVYAMLTRMDAYEGQAQVGPGVAESWERIDELVWEFKLREGLEFPSGDPVNAEAVRYSIEYVLDEQNEAGIRSTFLVMSDIEVVDEHTIRFTTSAPSGILPTLFTAMPIVPPEYHQEVGHDAFIQDPIGTGWFKVDSYTPGENLVLVPNEFAEDDDVSPDSIRFTVMPEDASRVAALKAGDVDIITRVPIDQIASIEADGFTVFSQVEARTYTIDVYTDEGPLSDPNVRRALNYAIDREGLVEGVLGGHGRKADGQPIGPDLTGYCEAIDGFEFDLDRANQILAEAGVDNLQLTMASSQGFLVNDVLLAQAVANQLQQLDAVSSVDIEVMEFSKFLDVYHGREPRPDLYPWGMSASPFLDASLQYARYTSDATRDIGYENPEFDARFDELSRLDAGSPERQEAMCDLARILQEDSPSLFVLELPDVWALAPGIENLAVDPSGNPAWHWVAKVQ